jgi:allantoicase
MAFEQISLDKYSQLMILPELSSIALGGKIVSVSDEFFAEASQLILVEAPPNLKGQFGPKGALFSGWETRRHNADHDWCIIKLGTTGTVSGFDIDTTHFNGNEAPHASVEALFSSRAEDPTVNDARWFEILPKIDLGPSSRHLFQIGESTSVNYVKLKIYPDGGIARFRVHGNVVPVLPDDVTASFDLAHVFAGGRVAYVSDQHFGVGSNLILPGRGQNMGDGWETKRSRQQGHKDWVIIKLGFPGYLELAEIDTAHFMGNYPESLELHAVHNSTLPANDIPDDDWTEILGRTKVGPHRRHFFQLENVTGKAYTHVKVTIHPDGGLKRVRIIGKRADQVSNGIAVANGATMIALNGTDHANGHTNGFGPKNGIETPDGTFTPPTPKRLSLSTPPSEQIATIPILPLTPEAFAPFGQVIQAYTDHNAAPRGVKITPANQGTASKFHKLALLDSSYPTQAAATAGLSVYRCNPLPSGGEKGEWEVNVLERHPYTNQAFIPMGGAGSFGKYGDGLERPGEAYLVVVAKNGSNDKPDLKTLRAFAATAAQGIVYNTAVWHQPMAVFAEPMDFTCVETQIGNGGKADCEIVDLDGSEGKYKVQLPRF